MLLLQVELTALDESVQKIHVGKNQTLTTTQITKALISAQNTRHYAKFICGPWYIQVNFQRDGTVDLSSNYRGNDRFTSQIFWYNRQKYSLTLYMSFIYTWMKFFILRARK